MMLGLETLTPEPAGDISRFGVQDVTDLTWKNLLDAFTCTECGRCTSVCPANVTGKKLSPRKIIMDVRDRAEVLARSNGEAEGHTLFDSITREEIFACTTCNACIDICPVVTTSFQRSGFEFVQVLPVQDLRLIDVVKLQVSIQRDMEVNNLVYEPLHAQVVDEELDLCDLFFQAFFVVDHRSIRILAVQHSPPLSGAGVLPARLKLPSIWH